MAGGVALVYLDIDDEITSAAARIRAAEEVRVALVVPSGSRLATSRINFRLLAREAQARSRQLLIVAPDAATRSLAASAGLSVYGTVRELEEAFAPAAGPNDPGASIPDPLMGAPIAGRSTTGPTTAADLAGLARPPDTAGRTGPSIEAEPTRVIATERPPMARPVGSPRREPDDEPYARVPAGRGGAPNLPIVGGGDRGRGGHRTAWLVGGSILVLIALVGGVLGYVFLPAAKIVVTPKGEPISLSFDVRADPAATTADPANLTVPATVETFPLDATAEFPATGKKVTETRATGIVTFTSRNTGAKVTIPAGTQVSTASGVVFVTIQSVTVPKAVFIPPTPGTAQVGVRAVAKGTDGNVSAGAISRAPSSIEAALVNVDDPVNNPNETTGGTHTEDVQVSAKDVTAATTALTKSLGEQLDAVIADPSQVLPGLTVFGATKSMTAPVPSVDPTTLVGQTVETFTLGLTATGSVTTVDEAAVTDVGTSRLLASISPDHVLVKGTRSVTVGDGRVQDGAIVFPVKATASQVRTVVAADLVAAVRGKTAAEARTILGAYGDVTLALWPGFSDRIPTYDFRIDLTVDQEGTPTESPGPSLPAGTARPTPRQTPLPSAASDVPSASGSKGGGSPSPSP